MQKEQNTKHEKLISKQQQNISIGNICYILQLHDGRIVSCTSNKAITITDINSKATLAVLSGHDKPITMIIQLQDGNFASCGSDAAIIVWDIKKETNHSIACLLGHREKINTIIELNNKILSCSNDQTIRLWDYKELRCMRIIYAHQSEILSMSLLKSNLLISHTKNEIKIWNAARFQCLTKIKINPKSTLNQILQLNDGRVISLFRKMKHYNLGLIVFNKNINQMNIANSNIDISIDNMMQLMDGRILGYNYMGDIVLINNETFECLQYLKKTDQIYNLSQFEEHKLLCVSRDGIDYWSI